MDDQAKIISEIKALSSHYPAKRLTHVEEARWLLDYAEDLARFEVLDVMLACRSWRQSDARKMPTPGELMVLCRRFAKPPVVALLPPPAPAPIEKSDADKGLVKSMVANWRKQLADRQGPVESQHEMAERLRLMDQAERVFRQTNDVTPRMRELMATSR